MKNPIFPLTSAWAIKNIITCWTSLSCTCFTYYTDKLFIFPITIASTTTIAINIIITTTTTSCTTNNDISIQIIVTIIYDSYIIIIIVVPNYYYCCFCWLPARYNNNTNSSNLLLAQENAVIGINSGRKTLTSYLVLSTQCTKKIFYVDL